MTERRRIIEGTWSCSSCGAKEVLGRHKKCPTCNNPREEGAEMKVDFGPASDSGRSERESVADDKATTLAAAGADWFCLFCAAGNRGDAPFCAGCQAPRPDNAPAVAPGIPAPPKARRRIPRWLWVVGGLVLVLGGFGYWGSQTHELGGTVESTHWRREITVERFTQVTAEDWQGALTPSAAVMPVDGKGESSGVEQIRNCRRQQRGTRKIPVGTERVCRTRSKKVQCGSAEKCTRRDLGNGFAEESCQDIPKYCDQDYQDCRDETRYREEPVYEPFCEFTTWRWQPADRAESSGADGPPSWPAIPPGSLDRLSRKEEYRVEVRYQHDGKSKQHTLEPQDEAEYLRWTPGAPVRIVANNLGRVTGAEPVGSRSPR